jgi:hypothetical protein
MLAAMAGTVWAQDWAQDWGAPGAAQPMESAANPSGLPHAMSDETFGMATQQILTATKAMSPDLEPVTPLHLRYELKMVDYKGKEDRGTYETWSNSDAVHTEIHTGSYNESDLQEGDSVWLLENGLRPLRIREFAEVRLLYLDPILIYTMGQQTPVAMSALGCTPLGVRIDEATPFCINTKLEEPKLKLRTVDGASLLCGGDDARSICFDPTTGYVSLAILGEDKVAYEGWKQIGSQHLAAVVRRTFGKHLLFEAKLTEALDTVSPDTFAVPAGATEEPQGVSFSEQLGVTFPVEQQPQMPISAHYRPMPSGLRTGGQAIVTVWVNEKGRVTKAVVVDADDKENAEAAYEQATATVQLPNLENGHPASSETSYYLHRSVGGGARWAVPEMVGGGGEGGGGGAPGGGAPEGQ